MLRRSELRQHWRLVLLFVPLDVVGIPLQKSIQRNDVPHVQPNSVRVQSSGDAFQLVAILLLDVRPELALGGVAKEIPASLGVVSQLERDHALRVADLRRQQVTVLITDLRRRAFQMHVGPPVFPGAPERALHARVGPRLPRHQRHRLGDCPGEADRVVARGEGGAVSGISVAFPSRPCRLNDENSRATFQNVRGDSSASFKS